MLNFNGIEPEGLWLLAENRLKESKAFYDENKGRLKILVSEPMSALVRDITPMMSRLDRHMHLNPDGSISKIKSDARGAKDRPLYRDKVWFMLRRLGGMPVPGLWFEVSPSYYGYGLCVLNSCPKFMQFFRNHIDHSRRALGHALRPAESFGFSVGGEEYKRPKKSGLKGRIS
ncbi:MAG TPA: hypothetical protein DEQ02_01605, partial [Ruminococcaceae bacterium]|nr:hypothetical protein [Oscillospiraceae bacterium]